MPYKLDSYEEAAVPGDSIVTVGYGANLKRQFSVGGGLTQAKLGL